MAREVLITAFKAAKSVIFEVTFEAAEAETMISWVGAYMSCFSMSFTSRLPDSSLAKILTLS